MFNRKSFKRIISGVFILTIVTGMSLTTATANAQKQYKIMGDRKEGTKFRHVEATSPIPFNKSWARLTSEQQELFRASYGGLAAHEIPPFPKKGTEVIYKPIIKAHNIIKEGGNLFMVAIIDENGKVENVAVYETPHAKITEVATAALFSTEFKPATCAGEPCKMEFPFEFKLRTVDKNLRQITGR